MSRSWLLPSTLAALTALLPLAARAASGPHQVKPGLPAPRSQALPAAGAPSHTPSFGPLVRSRTLPQSTLRARGARLAAQYRPTSDRTLSLTDAGQPALGDSGNPSVSRDGLYVAFESTAANLVPGDTNDRSDVFVKNLTTGELRRVSVTAAGGQADGDSGGPSLSPDGRYVAFWSLAGNLVPLDTNQMMDVFVKDLATGEIRRASTTSFEQEANGASFDACLSADGRTVAFVSEATNLVAGDSNGSWDVFVKNLASGVIRRASVDAFGGEARGDSGWPSLTPDGRAVAFESLAANLVPYDTNNVSDIFVKDLVTGTVQRASVTDLGVDGDSPSHSPSLSADARRVAFWSEATNLVEGDTNGRPDVFVKDLPKEEVWRLTGPAPLEASGDNLYPALSADGRFVAFYATAPEGDPEAVAGLPALVFAELETGITRAVEARVPGLQEEGYAVRPALTADGRLTLYQAFTESASGQGQWDVFARRLRAAVPHDYDGDSRSDVLWRNETTGENALWLMDGPALRAADQIQAVPDLSWQAAASGDFNGDGRSDILWRNGLTGENGLWLMDGLALVAADFLQPVTDLSWRLIGTGDFDGDGRSDIFWRNGATGQNAVWLMDGFRLASAAFLPTADDLSWQVVGIGDFDGDGRSDLLWRHALTGDNAIWRMDGTSLAEGRPILAIFDLSWQAAGVGDFDGDGRADILWRNGLTGDNGLWQMSGFELRSAAFLPSAPDLGWQVAGLGDFDGDGRSDILWRHFLTGENGLWLMKGSVLSSGQFLSPVTDLGWHARGLK